MPTANGKPIRALRVAYSIRLIKVSLCHQHGLALTAWLTAPAKGSLYGACRKHSGAHFSCGRYNLSSRQQLKDTNIGGIEQRAGESFHFVQNRSIKGANGALVHLMHQFRVILPHSNLNCRLNSDCILMNASFFQAFPRIQRRFSSQERADLLCRR